MNTPQNNNSPNEEHPTNTTNDGDKYDELDPYDVIEYDTPQEVPSIDKIDPFDETGKAIYELLEFYGIDTTNDDVQQNILNTSVAIQNAFDGYNSDGQHTGLSSC